MSKNASYIYTDILNRTKKIVIVFDIFVILLMNHLYHVSSIILCISLNIFYFTKHFSTLKILFIHFHLVALMCVCIYVYAFVNTLRFLYI